MVEYFWREPESRHGGSSRGENASVSDQSSWCGVTVVRQFCPLPERFLPLPKISLSLPQNACILKRDFNLLCSQDKRLSVARNSFSERIFQAIESPASLGRGDD